MLLSTPSLIRGPYPESLTRGTGQAATGDGDAQLQHLSRAPPVAAPLPGLDFPGKTFQIGASY